MYNKEDYDSIKEALERAEGKEAVPVSEFCGAPVSTLIEVSPEDPGMCHPISHISTPAGKSEKIRKRLLSKAEAARETKPGIKLAVCMAGCDEPEYI